MSHATLTDEQAAFLAGGVSLIIASRDMRRVPSLVRALGCRVEADRRTLTMWLEAAASRQVLRDIAATGQVAAVFSQPSTHHTLQVKGNDARVVASAAGDAELIEQHRQAFAADLVRSGYPREFALAIHATAPGDEIAAVAFSVDAIFEQTPGPGAGQRIGGAA